MSTMMVVLQIDGVGVMCSEDFGEAVCVLGSSPDCQP